MKIQESPQAFCPNCGSPTRSGQKFCRACGSQTAQIAPTDPTQQVFCGQCGAALNKAWKFCFVCAAPLLNLPLLLQKGHILDKRYEIVQVLGQGGMGAVYKAMDTRFSKHPFVAMKELNRDGLTTAELSDALEQFRREADLLRALQHPNLPRVHDHFVEQGKPYLVMDFVEGETLEVALQKQGGGFQEQLVLKIGKDLCTVLSYLHAQHPPIIFRDLKPANIMLSATQHLSLIDFGIARHFKPGQTKDTVAWGSAGYAAPEQFGRAQTDARSDEYSLGVVLYELLTGDDPTTLVFMQGRRSIGQVPHAAHWERLLDTMCNMNANMRYSSLNDVLKELTTMEAGNVNARVFSVPVAPLQPSGLREVALFYNRADNGLAKELATHLTAHQRAGLNITVAQNIDNAGGSGLIAEAWERRMRADIVVLLLSADFAADDNLRKRGNELIHTRPDDVIIVQLRPLMLIDQGTYNGHPIIPAQAITLYSSSKKENAWLEVVNEILKKVTTGSTQPRSLAPAYVNPSPPTKKQQQQGVAPVVSPLPFTQPMALVSKVWQITILFAFEDEKWSERFVMELVGMQQDTFRETGIHFDIHAESMPTMGITNAIAHSQMTVLLLSPHFIASQWMDHYEEFKVTAQQAGQALIPVWLLDCEWDLTQTTPLQPIEDLRNDAAWKEVAGEIVHLFRKWYPQEIPPRSHLALPTTTARLGMPSGSTWMLTMLVAQKDREWIRSLETYLAAFRRSLQSERGITLLCQEAGMVGTDEELVELLTHSRLLLPLISADFRASKWMLQYPTIEALLQSRKQYPFAIGIRECLWEHGQVPLKAIGSRSNAPSLVEVARLIRVRLHEYYPSELP